MKFKKILITGIALLGLTGIGAIRQSSIANADPTPAERNASIAADNALTQKYGNHVPASASLQTETNLNKEFGGPSKATKGVWNATVGQQHHTTFNNYYHSNGPANNAKNSQENYNSKANNKSVKKNKQNSTTLHKRANRTRKKTPKKTHKDKRVHKTNSVKGLKNRPTHHYFIIGISIIVIIAVIGIIVRLVRNDRR